MHFHKISFKIDNFDFIVLTIISPVFDCGYVIQKSFTSKKGQKKSRKGLEIYIQHCVGTLHMVHNQFPASAFERWAVVTPLNKLVSFSLFSHFLQNIPEVFFVATKCWDANAL